MQKIKLNNSEWEIDTKSPLGKPGGFGAVFRGMGNDGHVAIKRLNITATQACYREMSIGEHLLNRELNHVVPIYDLGQDSETDRYYIVMPVCDHSLQDVIDKDGPFTANLAVSILLEILYGLNSVDNITHRDIKPANILFHEGEWKIADFGIAKFVEDSTSLETLRISLTPTYAAPEQWREERPTAATDVYALGCIAHALTTGHPPFSGEISDLKEQHLKGTPQPIEEFPARARALISQMLRKAPEARPSRTRCVHVLKEVQQSENTPDGQPRAALVDAVGVVAAEQAVQETKERERQELAERRNALYQEAASDLTRIRDRMYGEIKNFAGDVLREVGDSSRLRFGNATLMFDTSTNENRIKGIIKSDIDNFYEREGWGVHQKKSSWDIIGYGSIFVEQQVNHKFYKRSANLVYGRPHEEVEYRWYEMSFFSIGKKKGDEPHCLQYIWDIDLALSHVGHTIQKAHDPVPIDGENEDQFINYWIDLFANAAAGKLNPPRFLPIDR